jgi:hypothetical protein
LSKLPLQAGIELALLFPAFSLVDWRLSHVCSILNWLCCEYNLKEVGEFILLKEKIKAIDERLLRVGIFRFWRGKILYWMINTTFLNQIRCKIVEFWNFEGEEY